MSHVLRPGFEIYDDVVKVNQRGDPTQRAEELIHEALIDGRGVL
jgi:hypothetical protein